MTVAAQAHRSLISAGHTVAVGLVSRRSFLTGSAGLGALVLLGSCTGEHRGATSSNDGAASSVVPGATTTPAPEVGEGDYVPPPTDSEWERIAPMDAGWDPAGVDAALAFAGEQRSQSVVWVSAGKIMAEQQWGVAPDWPRDVASVQKSVTAVLCAMARDQGLLDFQDAVSDMLGPGWTADDDAEAEGRITVEHLLSMTSGLDTDLRVIAMPGTEWLYNNDAYHRLHEVLEVATGTGLEDLTRSWLWEPIGVRNASWVTRPGEGPVSVDATGQHLNGLVMNAYDLARFALLVQRGGAWGDERVVASESIEELLRPSSELNPSYGLLWWLNGQDAYRAPGADPPLQPGPFAPGAPDDMVAALGAADQKAYVIRSLDCVLTRLGRSAEGTPLEAFSGFDGEWLSSVSAARTD